MQTKPAKLQGRILDALARSEYAREYGYRADVLAVALGVSRQNASNALRKLVDAGKVEEAPPQQYDRKRFGKPVKRYRVRVAAGG